MKQSRTISQSRQAAIGLALGGGIISAWLALHITSVFFFPIRADLIWIIAPIVLLQCWLYVGLFIIAHDCMHGSLVPFRPAINRWVGQLCLHFYAGFDFDALNRKHHFHHRYSGTSQDPDFDAEPPHGFLAWYWKFFREYFGWREYFLISGVTLIYILLLGVNVENVVVFWAMPALISSLQLFTFGTYLPHRPNAIPFVDRHNARTNQFSWWLSLLSCFHFGYHHEHHLEPDVPWWRLPQAHADYLAAQGSATRK